MPADRRGTEEHARVCKQDVKAARVDLVGAGPAMAVHRREFRGHVLVRPYPPGEWIPTDKGCPVERLGALWDDLSQREIARIRGRRAPGFDAVPPSNEPPHVGIEGSLSPTARQVVPDGYPHSVLARRTVSALS